MRRSVTIAAIVLLAAALPSVARAAGPPLPTGLTDACQPDPSLPGPQVLHCRYGPLTVTPGANMILFGPVTIESPRADGYVTSFAPNLVDATTGQVPPVHEVHLHHGVWLNPANGAYTPFFATGEEKTRATLPADPSGRALYGYRTRPTDTWVLNYMLHNLTANTYTVFIRYDLTWVPATTPGVQEVVPVWFDAVGGRDATKAIYPVYNPTDSGPDVGPDPAAPSGQSHRFTATFRSDRDAELVWAGGHVHPGGVRDELRAESCNGAPAASKLLFSSDAVMNQAPSFGSWDYRMTVTPPEWRYTMRAGDTVSVTGYYDTAHPWYEAMAIMFAWARPLSPAEAAASPSLCATPPTTGSPTAPPDDPPNPTPVFGGGGEHPAGTAPGPATKSVTISGFGYSPGGQGQPPAAVHRGDVVTFSNVDAGASIFHTVTSCASPCNGEYGQKYPLATWPSTTDLGDSGQLGYGPPLATAAVQRASWTYTVPTDAPDGSVLDYFCRIHPFMRGALEVTP